MITLLLKRIFSSIFTKPPKVYSKQPVLATTPAPQNPIATAAAAATPYRNRRICRSV
jgi:hypothetical protein